MLTSFDISGYIWRLEEDIIVCYYLTNCVSDQKLRAIKVVSTLSLARLLSISIVISRCSQEMVDPGTNNHQTLTIDTAGSHDPKVSTVSLFISNTIAQYK